MPGFTRILLLVLLSTGFLFSMTNTLQKAMVKKGELSLSFKKRFAPNEVKHFTLHHPHREIYDLKNTRLSSSRVPKGLGVYVKMAQYKNNTVRIVIHGTQGYKAKSYQSMFGSRTYNIVLPKGKLPKSAAKKKVTPKPAKTKSIAKKPSIKKPRVKKPVHVGKNVEKVAPVYYQKGKKHSHKYERIVIDAGHGGHDPGAIGGSKREKDLVLQIAKRLEKELKKRGHPVYMTRKSDRFLKLSQRTKIADKRDAVVFISIHANSVPKKKRHKIQGIETFFLQKTRDARSQRIAARENKSVLKGTTKLSQNVIIDSVLTGPKIVESNKLAIDVQRNMMRYLGSQYKGVRDGGVRHAPFWVLVGASRPSILVEVGYISHPKERKRLFTSKYQSLLARGIAEGIDNYLNNRKQEIDF